MKIHPWHLLIGSIVLFLLDFLILANKMIFPGRELERISLIIAFVCALIFGAGIVWAIFEPLAKMTKPSAMAMEKSRFALTALEIVFNRLGAVLLVLSAIPLLLNILTIPTIVIFVVFAFFLWLGKKYHPLANIIFLIFALGIYFVPIPPIDWGIFRGLKEFRLGGFDLHQFALFFCAAPLIFISFSVRNVLGNIWAYFKTGAIERNVFYLISLIIILMIILAYPLIS